MGPCSAYGVHAAWLQPEGTEAQKRTTAKPPNTLDLMYMLFSLLGKSCLVCR